MGAVSFAAIFAGNLRLANAQRLTRYCAVKFSGVTYFPAEAQKVRQFSMWADFYGTAPQAPAGKMTPSLSVTNELDALVLEPYVDVGLVLSVFIRLGTALRSSYR